MNNQYQQEVEAKLLAAVKDTGSKDILSLDNLVRLAYKERHRNTRYAAVDKINAIRETWNQKHAMSEEVEALLDQITGAILNLRYE